jgi:hypothetical protein
VGGSYFGDKGQRDDARKLLWQAVAIEDDNAKSLACGEIAESWAGIGDLYHSWQIASGCAQPNDKLRAYTAIVLEGAKAPGGGEERSSGQ